MKTKDYKKAADKLNLFAMLSSTITHGVAFKKTDLRNRLNNVLTHLK